MRGVVRLGDKLTSGGVVITASSSLVFMRKTVTLIGDKVSCPIEGHGINSIIEGSGKWFANNKAVVIHGCKCACGCSVISSLSNKGEN